MAGDLPNQDCASRDDPPTSAGREGLTAIVISYNSADLLAPCLSALQAAERVDRVIVIDNASQDGSADLARTAIRKTDSVLELGHNRGFAGGCNAGFQEAVKSARWLAFLNPDVVVRPDCLATCVSTLASRQDVAAVAPRLMRPDMETVDSVGQVLDRRTLEVRDRGYGSSMSADLERPREVLAACGALSVFRREALVEITEDDFGPWAEHYFCFWEDLEIGWRLANHRFKTVTVPEAVAIHTRGAGASPGTGPLRWRRPPELEACVLTNRWMTLIRHLHPIDFARRFPILMAWDLALPGLGIARRPRLMGHLLRRRSLLRSEWRRRSSRPRRRLAELPAFQDHA